MTKDEGHAGEVLPADDNDGELFAAVNDAWLAKVPMVIPATSREGLIMPRANPGPVGV